MSKWNDIMSMVKAGYKPNEIKEIFELGKEPEPDPEEKDEEENEPDPEEKDDEDGKGTESDWKEQYNDLKKKLEQLQKENSNREIDKDNPDTFEEAENALADLIRS